METRMCVAFRFLSSQARSVFLIFSFSPLFLPPFSLFPLSLFFFSCSYFHYHARIFTRVVFLPHMLAFRDTGGIAQKPQIYVPNMSSCVKNYHCFYSTFSFLLLHCFAFSRIFVDLPSLRYVDIYTCISLISLTRLVSPDKFINLLILLFGQK